MVVAIVTGILLGGMIGFLKDRILWDRYIRKAETDAYANGESGAVYSRAIASNLVNLAAIALFFVIGYFTPVDMVPFVLSAATGLVAANLFMAGRRKM